jgi:hypothetical protein
VKRAQKKLVSSSLASFSFNHAQMMFWTNLVFPSSIFVFVVFMEQLMALGIEPGEQDSADKSLAALKSELVEEKAARVKAQTEVETLALAVEDLKKIADRFVTQIPTLEEKVKHLDNKVLDGPTELHAKELNLERTTKANEDYKSQNARLPHELESKLPSPVLPRYCILLNILLTPL